MDTEEEQEQETMKDETIQANSNSTTNSFNNPSNHNNHQLSTIKPHPNTTANTRWVHFNPSHGPSTHHLSHRTINSEKPDHQSPTTQFIQTWNQRHSILSRLTSSTLLKPTDHFPYDHLKPNSTHHISYDYRFGLIIELAIQQQQQPIHPKRALAYHQHHLLDPQSQTTLKLLKRAFDIRLDPQRDLILIRRLSQGQSGSVYLVKTRLSNFESLNQSNLYILKTVPKRVSKKIQLYSSIETELSILLISRSQAPELKPRDDRIPIPKLYSSFQTEQDLNLIIQFNSNGTISDYLTNVIPHCQPFDDPQNPYVLQEDLFRIWSIDIVSALDWLHNRHHFCHRDIKPSNLLIDHLGHILLNDFGTAAPLIPSASDHHGRLIVPLKYRTVIVGTCDYIAPEILQVHLNQTIANLNQSSSFIINQDEEDRSIGSYGPEVDFWSFGISLYELVYDRLPFFSQSISDTYNRIVSHQDYLEISECSARGHHHLRYPSSPNSNRDSNCDDTQINKVRVSEELRSFLQMLICTRDQRIGCGKEGIEQVKKHVWFAALDWNETRRLAVPCFTHSPLDMNRIGDSVVSQSNQVDDTDRFNFSAFFGSSPGLTALKTNPHDDNEENETVDYHRGSRERLDDQQDDISIVWGFTYLPSDPDEFNRPQSNLDHHHFQPKLKSSIKPTTTSIQGIHDFSKSVSTHHYIKKLLKDDDRFSTPMKPVTHTNRTRNYRTNRSSSSLSSSQREDLSSTRGVVVGGPQTTNRANRTIRLKTREDGRQIRLSEMDELLELNQFVIWTAKKAKPHFKLFPQHRRDDDGDRLDLIPLNLPSSNSMNKRSYNQDPPPPTHNDLEVNLTHQQNMNQNLQDLDRQLNCLLNKIDRLISHSDQILLRPDQIN